MKREFKSLIMREDCSLRDAMLVLDKYFSQIVLIVDSQNRMVGTVTDGDIRRSLLRGGGLDTQVSQSMNRDFKYIKKSDSFSPESFMIKNSIHHAPVLDEKGLIVDVFFIDDINRENCLDNPVVIMAGGQGKRLRPLTENCPKPMLPIGGKPMLEIIIEQLTSDGFSNIYISVNYLKEQIISYFKDGSDWHASIKYLHENKPLGTAGSLKLLSQEIDKPFLVMNGDVLTRTKPHNVLDYYHKSGSYATICARNYSVSVPFGVIEVDGGNLSAIKEKPSVNYLVNAGIYALNPAIFEFINDNEFLDMPELLLRAKNKNKNISVFPVHEYWLDVGRPETLKIAHTDWLSDNHL